MSDQLYVDVIGRELNVGDHIGCAFSYSRASVGYIRLGIIEELNDPEDVRIRWDETGKVSPAMVFGNKSRWIKLD